MTDGLGGNGEAKAKFMAAYSGALYVEREGRDAGRGGGSGEEGELGAGGGRPKYDAVKDGNEMDVKNDWDKKEEEGQKVILA